MTAIKWTPILVRLGLVVGAHSVQLPVLGLMGATSPALPQQPVPDDPRWPPCLLGTSGEVQCLLQTPSGSGYRQPWTENVRLLFFLPSSHSASSPHSPPQKPLSGSVSGELSFRQASA